MVRKVAVMNANKKAIGQRLERNDELYTDSLITCLFLEGEKGEGRSHRFASTTEYSSSAIGATESVARKTAC